LGGSRVSIVVAIGIFALSSRAWADRVDDLSQVLVTDSSWRVRLQAAVVLGRLHDKRSVPALLRALSDPVDTVRGMAAQVLGDLGDATALAALERSKRDPSSFVRGQALVAVGKLSGTPAPKPTLVAPAPRFAANAMHVEVGGVGSKAPSTPPELTQKLRDILLAKLQRTPGLTLDGTPRTGYLIDSAITSLSRRNNGDFVEVSCEVSLILGRLPSKAMLMMTSGGATVQAPRAGFRPDRERTLQHDALEGAVHGAHENLLAFLKTMH
jgi:hypothetical protein